MTATRQRRQSNLKRLILPAVAVAYLAYFGFWAFHGHYGIWAKARFESEAAALNAELADLSSQRTSMERRVALLRSESVDQDLLDEQARQALNMLQPNDLVIDTAQQKTR
jgi:cell division protein FtsB